MAGVKYRSFKASLETLSTLLVYFGLLFFFFAFYNHLKAIINSGTGEYVQLNYDP